jgi:hypothetical protein
LSVSGRIGDVISYKLKATNQAGFSIYSQTLVVKVGSVPNAPVSLTTVKFITANEVQVTWNEGSAVKTVNMIKKPEIDEKTTLTARPALVIALKSK